MVVFGASANRQSGFGYNNRDIYNDMPDKSMTGVILEKAWKTVLAPTGGKPPFFRDIRIYGMDQRKYAEYVLINPIDFKLEP
jgi:hypothetical protein